MSAMDVDDEDLNELKTVKISIPAYQVIKLRTLRVITGQTISDTMAEAVDNYLKKLEGEAPDLAENLPGTRTGASEPA
jgi:DNA-binding protein Fis